MTRKATNFGKNLKTLRKRSGYNQTQLGELFGLERTTLSNYENGISEPALFMVVKVAAHFNITLDELLTGDICQNSLRQVNSDSQSDNNGSSASVKKDEELIQLRAANKHMEEKILILEDYIATLKQVLPEKKVNQHREV